MERVRFGGSSLSISIPPRHLAQDLSKLQQMTSKHLIDVARGRGLTYGKEGNELRKSELAEHIFDSQSFAASLRAKHPSSSERGASARGGWWGFLGDYTALDPKDLETEAMFCGVRLVRYNP